MNVLSLFDGISCARVALDRAGIKVKTYYASEIEKNAIKVSQQNYPDIVRLGDVREIQSIAEPIDLLIGGSPCQDLSIAKKDRKGLEGDRSSLFYEYVRIRNLVKPKYFILENVASMSKTDKETITKELGVEPVLFNASLVSAQSRKRYFWTNIQFDLPVDKNIKLKDILQDDAEVDERFVMKDKSFCLTASYSKTSKFPKEKEAEHEAQKKQRTLVKQLTLLDKPKEHEFIQLGYFGAENHCKVGGQALRVYDVSGKSTTSGVGLYKIGHIGNNNAQANRVYDPDGKAVTLSANGGGLGAKTGLYQIETCIRKDEKANCLVSSHTTKTSLVATGRDIGRRLNAEGKREDNNTELPIQRRIELRSDEKSGTLTSVTKDNLVVNKTCIRKLTPIECERLQGLPDDYTKAVSMTNRYKCLGNAFNVDVVAHILMRCV